MTTIAYKDGVIAYDSRSTRGDFISTDSANKMNVRDGVRFFMAGCACYEDEFASAWFSGADVCEQNDVSALVYDGEHVWMAGADNGEFFRQRIDYDTAIGSGTPYAVTAMDFGASAKEAVKAASKRDSATGGRIRTFKVKK